MPVKSITIGPGTLTIGSDTELTNFSSQVTKCSLVPKVTVADPLDVLSGEQVPGDRTETNTLEGSFLQDFGAADSTTEWLWEHRGETHDFVYAPSAANGREITGQLTVEAINIGGDVKTKPTSDFVYTLVGEPVFAAIVVG
jgi:hypothetical protein